MGFVGAYGAAQSADALTPMTAMVTFHSALVAYDISAEGVEVIAGSSAAVTVAVCVGMTAGNTTEDTQAVPVMIFVDADHAALVAYVVVTESLEMVAASSAHRAPAVLKGMLKGYTAEGT